MMILPPHPLRAMAMVGPFSQLLLHNPATESALPTPQSPGKESQCHDASV